MPPEALTGRGIGKVNLNERALHPYESVPERYRSMRVRTWVNQKSLYLLRHALNVIKQFTLVVRLEGRDLNSQLVC